jgi:hypothetical protein
MRRRGRDTMDKEDFSMGQVANEMEFIANQARCGRA